jgi:hypothetical protein
VGRRRRIVDPEEDEVASLATLWGDPGSVEMGEGNGKSSELNIAF